MDAGSGAIGSDWPNKPNARFRSTATAWRKPPVRPECEFKKMFTSSPASDRLHFDEKQFHRPAEISSATILADCESQLAATLANGSFDD
jgi:hypothetical protein